MKRADELKPGDVVYWFGQRVTVEMVQPECSTVLIRHSLAKLTCKSFTLWLVDMPADDIVRQAERIATVG